MKLEIRVKSKEITAKETSFVGQRGDIVIGRVVPMALFCPLLECDVLCAALCHFLQQDTCGQLVIAFDE